MTTDPITRAVDRYIEYLKGGGTPVNLADHFNVVVERDKQRKLHPSSLGPGLCDRAQCFKVMADVGEVKPDFEFSDHKQRDFHLGYVFQDEIARALVHAGALIDMERKVETDRWTGRIDLVVDPARLVSNDDLDWLQRQGWAWMIDNPWVPDVKTVKGYGLYNRYPKEYHVAQVERYKEMLAGTEYEDCLPVLYYVTRVDWQSGLFLIDWFGGTCTAHAWPGSEVKDKTFPNLVEDIQMAAQRQEKWLATGELPNRCGEDPAEHPFMCSTKIKYGADRGKRQVNCQFFSRCWDKGAVHDGVFDPSDYQDSGYNPF